jgi:hypothetical protein
MKLSVEIQSNAANLIAGYASHSDVVIPERLIQGSGKAIKAALSITIPIKI